VARGLAIARGGSGKQQRARPSRSPPPRRAQICTCRPESVRASPGESRREKRVRAMVQSLEEQEGRACVWRREQGVTLARRVAQVRGAFGSVAQVLESISHGVRCMLCWSSRGRVRTSRCGAFANLGDPRRTSRRGFEYACGGSVGVGWGAGGWRRCATCSVRKRTERCIQR
jgi:hypothetical protein